MIVGIIDKMVVIFEYTCSSGQNGWCFFSLFSDLLKLNIIFVLSSKTEVGSSGEQPARDKLEDRRKSLRRRSSDLGLLQLF